MGISYTAVILLIFVLIFSVFVANVADLVKIENESMEKKYTHAKSKLKITNTTEHLVWFLQISDLHLSIFHDSSRISDFQEFCEKTIDVYNPAVVLASGDLTDAKARDNVGSQQFETEWQSYRKSLDRCKVNEKTVWLDIRGNHDSFNVIEHKSKQNFYVNYSIQGQMYPHSYKHQITVDGDKYTFIAIDVCLEPGLRRPFNFIGLLTASEKSHIEQLAHEASASGSNYTIWFGHYPTSCILSADSGGIRSLIGKYPEGYAYLCGHFHTFGGMLPNMYTMQRNGFLELELGDWKDNKLYRLLVMDHGLLSFIDIRHNEWPVAVITNPKHALYIVPNREPLELINESTHIRVMAFSTSKITSVEVKINNEGWMPCTNIEGPLYTAPWNPKKYQNGVHQITVLVVDEFGREKLYQQPFTLDQTRLNFGFLARMALMSNTSQLFQLCFAGMLLVCVFPLCLLRIWNYCIVVKKLKPPQIRYSIVRRTLQKFWVLATVDRLFYPLVIYAIFISVGPWSIGYIVEDYLGVIFIWGIIVNGSFLPGSFTYAYGFLQLFSFQLPLTILLAWACDSRLQLHAGKPEYTRTKLISFIQHLIYSLIVISQLLFAYMFWLSYGTLAFLLGPLRTWSVILAVYLWYQANNLPEKCIRNAAYVWRYKISNPTIKDNFDVISYRVKD